MVPPAGCFRRGVGRGDNGALWSRSTSGAVQSSSRSELEGSFVPLHVCMCVCVACHWLLHFSSGGFSKPRSNISETTHTHTHIQRIDTLRQAMIFPAALLRVSPAPTSSLLPVGISRRIDHLRFLGASFPLSAGRPSG